MVAQPIIKIDRWFLVNNNMAEEIRESFSNEVEVEISDIKSSVILFQFNVEENSKLSGR